MYGGKKKKKKRFSGLFGFWFFQKTECYTRDMWIHCNILPQRERKKNSQDMRWSAHHTHSSNPVSWWGRRPRCFCSSKYTNTNNHTGPEPVLSGGLINTLSLQKCNLLCHPWQQNYPKSAANTDPLQHDVTTKLRCGCFQQFFSLNKKWLHHTRCFIRKDHLSVLSIHSSRATHCAGSY